MMSLHQKPNPYASPKGTSSSHARIPIPVLLLTLLWLAIISAGWIVFGAAGLIAAVALVGLAWFVLSRTTVPALHPINRRRMTLVELLSSPFAPYCTG